MRIIDTDNFGGDYPNEKFLMGFYGRPLEVSTACAEKIADALNDDVGRHSDRCYRAVPNDYVLQPGFELEDHSRLAT